MLKKILLADDEEPCRALITATLSDGDCYRFLEARNGLEALEIARREKPGLILLDIRMPSVDGFEVCRRLKADSETRHITIVVLTALAQEKDKEHVRQVGADAYLAKPFSPTELLNIVDEVFAYKKV